VEREQPDLERIRRLAAELAASDPGPAGQLAAEVAESLADLSARVDALWQLISAVVTAAGLGLPAEAARPRGTTADADQQAEFARAIASARMAGKRGLRLSIDGREWVAALSEQASGQPAWSALERLARESSAQDDEPALDEDPDQDDR
jgi:hypothetical protein